MKILGYLTKCNSENVFEGTAISPSSSTLAPIASETEISRFVEAIKSFVLLALNKIFPNIGNCVLELVNLEARAILFSKFS